MTERKLPLVAIVGRINVGKSTLFNKLTGTHKAITAPVAGTTRDVVEDPCLWCGRTFALVDTGGLDPAERGTIAFETLRHAQRAIDEADVIVFAVDARTGPVAHDRAIALTLRKTKKPVVVAVNKAERIAARDEYGSFAALGFADMIPVSALTGMGTGDLLDEILKYLPASASENSEEQKTKPIAIGLFGRPNAGKSSLMNAIVGREEAIVHERPHTTRDIKTIPFSWGGRDFALVDTAGIRKRAPRIKAIRNLIRFRKRTEQEELDAIEFESVQRTRAITRRVDVVCVLLPADEPFRVQDARIASMMLEKARAGIIVVTKADTLPKEHQTYSPELTRKIHKLLPGLFWAPVVLTSATTAQGVEPLLKTAMRIYEHWTRVIPPETLSSVLHAVKKSFFTPKTPVDARNIAIRRIEQIGSSPPHFLLFMRSKSMPPPALVPIVEKILRRFVDLEGTPIKIEIKKG